MTLRRLFGSTVLVAIVASGCGHSAARLSSVQLDGGNSRGRFAAKVSYPETVKHGPDVRILRFDHRVVRGGALASYRFGVALEHTPAGCTIQNMMLWSEAQGSLGNGWPSEGFNLTPDIGPYKTVQDVPLATNCIGVLRLAIVAVPKGGQPIVKHISIRVT